MSEPDGSKPIPYLIYDAWDRWRRNDRFRLASDIFMVVVLLFWIAAYIYGYRHGKIELDPNAY